MPSLQDLSDIKAGNEVPALVNVYLTQLVATALPQKERENFYDGTPAPALEASVHLIGEKGKEFLSMAAICQLALALAEDTTVDQDIRKHIATRRASAFIDMCLARKPPTGLEDPVAIFGWHRVAHASILGPLQDECAEVITSCTKLAYRQHMMPYLPEAETWYRRVVEYLSGVQYPIQLALIVCAGPERVTEELWEWNMKLAVLREAAGGGVTGEPGYPLPQGVMEHICKLVGMNAVELAQCDDTTKAQVRELFLELGKDIDHVEMLSDKVLRLLRNEPLGVGQVRVVKLQVFDFEQMFGPLLRWIGEKQRNGRAKEFVEGTCRYAGLYQ